MPIESKHKWSKKAVLRVTVHTLEGKYAGYPSVVTHQDSKQDHSCPKGKFRGLNCPLWPSASIKVTALLSSSHSCSNIEPQLKGRDVERLSDSEACSATEHVNTEQSPFPTTRVTVRLEASLTVERRERKCLLESSFSASVSLSIFLPKHRVFCLYILPPNNYMLLFHIFQLSDPHLRAYHFYS